MKNHIFSIVLFCLFCFCLTSCYIESGNNISRKLEKSITNLDEKYVIDNIGFHLYGGKPNTDLFQKRGSNEFKEFYFSLHKKYQPKEKNIEVEIINSVYKLKDNEKLFIFSEIEHYNVDLYYNIEKNELQRHYISSEERKLGYAGGTKFYLCFPEPVKARLLEYIEFDISITDEEGNVNNHHLHYDIRTRPVFKIGSTLWEYWSSI